MRARILAAATIAVAIASLIAAPSSWAADITPGLWEITMESRVAESPGFVPPPAQLTKCLTARDARDPSQIIGQVATQGATGCNYTERTYVGNTLTFAVVCAGAFAIVSAGKVSFTANTMEGSIAARANMGGQNVEMQNRLTARRLGGC